MKKEFENHSNNQAEKKEFTKLSYMKVTEKEIKQSYQLKSATSTLKIYPCLQSKARLSDLDITTECSISLSAR